MASLDQTTTLLRGVRSGDRDAAGRLLPLVYDELRALAGEFFRHQPMGHTLQPTALVHEAFLKMVDRSASDWTDRAHFFRVAAKAMRQVLIDHARGRKALKRGGDRDRVAIDDPAAITALHRVDLLAIDEALTVLAEVDPRQAEIVEMRFFGGATVEETARCLDVSPRTVELDWRMAKAWLSRTLSDTDGPS